jgi:hypothetical protein
MRRGHGPISVAKIRMGVRKIVLSSGKGLCGEEEGLKKINETQNKHLNTISISNFGS